ncbi:hypothetical protein SNEBB_005726 [Seison nebaliae]|nr:hypothetical protein SNEBB_005726 [Seison nebaliae]
MADTVCQLENYLKKYEAFFVYSNRKLLSLHPQLLESDEENDLTHCFRNLDHGHNRIGLQCLLEELLRMSANCERFDWMNDEPPETILGKAEIMQFVRNEFNPFFLRKMSEKKIYETFEFSHFLLENIPMATNRTIIFDVGCGVGHLERMLRLLENRKKDEREIIYYGIDGNETETRKASENLEKMKVYLEKKRAKGIGSLTLDEKKMNSHFIHQFIREWKELYDLIMKIYNSYKEIDFVYLVSLHGCGDLTNFTIFAFNLLNANGLNISLGVFPCCYHKMTNDMELLDETYSKELIEHIQNDLLVNRSGKNEMILPLKKMESLNSMKFSSNFSNFPVSSHFQRIIPKTIDIWNEPTTSNSPSIVQGFFNYPSFRLACQENLSEKLKKTYLEQLTYSDNNLLEEMFHKLFVEKMLKIVDRLLFLVFRSYIDYVLLSWNEERVLKLEKLESRYLVGRYEDYVETFFKRNHGMKLIFNEDERKELTEMFIQQFPLPINFYSIMSECAAYHMRQDALQKCLEDLILEDRLQLIREKLINGNYTIKRVRLFLPSDSPRNQCLFVRRNDK